MVGDIAAIARLERASLTAAHWSDQQYRDLFGDVASKPLRLALVAAAEENGAIVAFLVARQVSLEWELENIVVSAPVRGKGVGARLLAELLSRAETSRSSAVYLEVRESNTAARRLYEKAGLAETGRRKRYYSNPIEDAVLYSKTLQRGSISG